LNGGIDFTYTVSGDAATISGYTGSGGAVVVPAAIVHNGTACPVVSIGKNAFTDNSTLTAVTLPEGLTSIGMNAFSGCTGLTSITLPSSLTSIGNNGFFFCTGLTSVTLPASLTTIGSKVFYGCASLTSLTLPEGLTSIGSTAFSGCTKLASVTLPSSLTSIGMSAFSGCNGLTSVTLPEGLSSIGPSAFSDCKGLTSVNLPASLTTWGANAFSNCTALTSVTLSEGLTKLGDQTFQYCTGLTSITLPASLASFNVNAFQFCSNLADITVAAENTAFATMEGVLFNKALNTLLLYPAGRSGNSYTVPNGVISIDRDAFHGCTNLTSVTLPEGMTNIDSSTFQNCTKLTSVTLPASLRGIANEAFRDCNDLSAAYFLGSLPNQLNTGSFSNAHPDLVVYYHVSQAASWSGYTTYPAQAFCILTLDRQDGGAPENSYAALTDGRLAAPAEPTRDNYTFGGWYKEAACTNAFDFGSETVTGDVTLYAKWTATAENPKYTVAPVEDVSVYEVGEIEGIKTMTVKTSVTGLKYFGTLITPVVEHEGQEAVVFVHLRDGVQLSLNITKADFDVVEEAQSGFNVMAGDIVKVFIMDDLTNDVNHNPILLQ
ncbi:MAG TPA: hypothetical protein DCZ10_12005, partial [Pelotomaculum sp.]|nr:hypothetical protein [Pelotomaculum sp.]